MLYHKLKQEEINYGNGTIDKMKVYENVIYDSENVIKCERCNNVIFYIENEMYHVCPYKENKDEKIKIDESVIRNKASKYLCKIDKIENVCVNHEKELMYYKDSNYYCEECLKENEEYLNLYEIILTKDEIEKFKKLIDENKNILNQITMTHQNLMKKIKESFELFHNRNKSLINYCEGLLKFNEKYNKNFNLISTIRRISTNRILLHI